MGKGKVGPSGHTNNNSSINTVLLESSLRNEELFPQVSQRFTSASKCSITLFTFFSQNFIFTSNIFPGSITVMPAQILPIHRATDTSAQLPHQRRIPKLA